MKRASPTAYRSPEAKRCCDPAANITEISGSIIDGKPRVCIGASGSIAAVKTPEIVEKLISAGVHVDLVVTKPADFFMDVEYRGAKPRSTLARLQKLLDEDGTPWVQVWHDNHEWSSYTSMGDAVLHIELAKRNQLLVLAPLCANTLANIALGLCPNLLCSLVRAWHYDLDQAFVSQMQVSSGRAVMDRPLLAAPSMNTYMWYQSVTQTHVTTLEARGVQILQPVEKTLACGDVGKGAMAAVDDIVATILPKFWKQYAAEQAKFPKTASTK